MAAPVAPEEDPMGNPIGWAGDRFSDLGTAVRRTIDQANPFARVGEALEHPEQAARMQGDQGIKPAPSGPNVGSGLSLR